MKVFGRRMFSRMVPAAGVGVVAMQTFPTSQAPNPGYGNAVSEASTTFDLFSLPRSLFRDMIQKQIDPTLGKRKLRDWQRMSPNIAVLKSVSEQHKIHMMFKEQDETESQRKSWMLSIAKACGLPEDQIMNHMLY